MNTTTSLSDSVAAVLNRDLDHHTEITDLRRLSGGASLETWQAEAHSDQGSQSIIIRRDRPGTPPTSRRDEAELLRVVHDAGVPVPGVLAEHFASDDQPAYFVMDFLEGETIPRKLLRDERFETARQHLGPQVASALARVHSVAADKVGFLGPAMTPETSLSALATAVRTCGVESPVLELAIGWLHENAPAATDPVLVHGDVRNGNLMVTEDGLSAVLDWELAHIGQPAEDLGWFCVRAWRFGNDDKPAGGFCDRAQLLESYALAGGRPVSEEELRFWEMFGTLKWAATCVAQFDIHRRGDVRSVELAAIGRRLIEAEYDLLLLLEGL